MQGLPQARVARSGFGIRGTEDGCGSESMGPPGDTCLGGSLKRQNSRAVIGGTTYLFACGFVNE